MNDTFNLDRFVDAQDRSYSSVIGELKRGRKTGHWMWYVFPQIAGLGVSETSSEYSISCLEEGRAYLAHPILGRRLRECTQLVLDVDERTAERIFGYPDYLKFRSCMTLFSRTTDDNKIFLLALSKYYDGETDPLTTRLLAQTAADRR